MPFPSVSQLVAAYERKLPAGFIQKCGKHAPFGARESGKDHGNRPAPRSVANAPRLWLNPNARLQVPPVHGAPAPPVRPAHPTSPLNGINSLFGNVRQQEQALQEHVAAATVTSCQALPEPTGHAPATVVQDRGNPLDCVIKYVTHSAAGKVVVFNPADSTHRAGGLGVDHFRHASIPLEETLAVVGAGMKASLDQVRGGYPLGQEHAAQNQLYSRDITLRHSDKQLAALLAVKGSSSRDRLNQQRDLLLKFGVPTPLPENARFDMVSIAAVDRRGKGAFDASALESGLRRQLAHGLENAKSAGARTVVMPLPGSGLFARFTHKPDARQDPDYLAAMVRAAVWAIRTYGNDLRIVLPSHGAGLDTLIASALATPQSVQGAAAKPLPGAVVPANLKLAGHGAIKPVGMFKQGQSARVQASARLPAALVKKRMGNTDYFVEKAKQDLHSHSPVKKALGELLGDGSKVSVHRVHGVPVSAAGSQPYWFIGRDRVPGTGRALVSIEVSSGRREVFEVTFSRASLPALARKADLAKAL